MPTRTHVRAYRYDAFLSYSHVPAFDEPFTERLADCLGSKLWICHAYDSPPGFRTVAFRERLDAARHKLTAMLSLRSEAYRPFPFDHPKTPE